MSVLDEVRELTQHILDTERNSFKDSIGNSSLSPADDFINKEEWLKLQNKCLKMPNSRLHLVKFASRTEGHIFCTAVRVYEGLFED